MSIFTGHQGALVLQEQYRYISHRQQCSSGVIISHANQQQFQLLLTLNQGSIYMSNSVHKGVLLILGFWCCRGWAMGVGDTK